MRRSPLTPRNRLTCRECDEVIDGLSYTVRYGDWDAESQTYDRAPRTRHYCFACYREEHEREAGAYWELTDRDRLWDVLAAADGELVADCGPMFIGRRPFFRVVDGETQCVEVRRTAREHGETVRVDHKIAEVPFDRARFDRTFPADLPHDGDDEIPALVLLKPADETPFDDVDPLPADQATLTEVDTDG